MIEAIKNMLGMGPKTDYHELVRQGAIILDVRSKAEFAGGHIRDAINIPIDELPGNLAKLDKGKCIICCCASGMRSSAARKLLESKGYSQVHNGGGWVSLQDKI